MLKYLFIYFMNKSFDNNLKLNMSENTIPPNQYVIKHNMCNHCRVIPWFVGINMDRNFLIG